MASRAIWKGVIRIGKTKLPVKLYAAVQDHTIRFRLLHKTDKSPVKQEMVDPEEGQPVESARIQKAFPVTKNQLVIIEDEELEKIIPKESRDITISRFVDPKDIDHRWYERPYYLGPDGDSDLYFAAAEALGKKNREGVAHWVMRKKDYIGALREEDGYLVLVTLRYADEVIDVESLPRPTGRPLDKREIAMAEQLLGALVDKFDPSQFHDQYRERVMQLIKTKARGGKVKVTKFRARVTGDAGLEKALAASLKGVERRKKSA